MVGTRKTARSRSERTALLRDIHVGAKDLNLSEDRYRALLSGTTGHDSCKDCTNTQLAEVIVELKRLGWTKKPKKRFVPATTNKQAALVHVLWRKLGEAGALHTPTREGLRAFCVRQLGLGPGVAADPDMLSVEQLGPVIEALKDMCKRDGVKLR